MRKYIHRSNWVVRFNRQIRNAARYKTSLPSPESALHLVGGIAINTTYLGKKIGDLTVGLRKINRAC